MELKIPVEIEIPELAALQQALAGVTNKLADLEARIIELELGAEPPPPPPPDPDPEPPPPPPVAGPGTRLAYQGKKFWGAGANVGWYVWKEDFHDAPGKGIAEKIVDGNGALKMDHELVQRFEQAVAAGARLFTWWMFKSELGLPSQFTQQNGAPTAIKPAVFADIDAAVQLAEALDFYLVLAVIPHPAIVKPWLTNHMDALIGVLERDLFGRYADEPRIMAWQTWVEPDWEIWGDEIDLEPCQEYTEKFAAAVHRATKVGQLATINAAEVDGLPHWTGLGLDYYGCSYYPYMNKMGAWHEGWGGRYCALCRTYEDIAAEADLDGPLVIGEFHASPDAVYNVTGTSGGPREVWQAWYDKGFAGAMAWCLFPEKTKSPMPIDFTALAAFAAAHGDMGPA
jgi:hypothetical protein